MHLTVHKISSDIQQAVILSNTEDCGTSLIHRHIHSLFQKERPKLIEDVALIL